MPIIACGINHKTAPVALREQVVFLADKMSLYLQDLQSNENIREAVLLSTCNRSEIYCDTDQKEALFGWFCRQHHVAPDLIRPVWYCYEGETALQHIMQVSCGLDSMVLGEPEVLGQMKDAFSESCAAGLVGPQFNRLFQEVFAVAKNVRTHTAIGGCPVSIASASVNLLKHVFPGALSTAKVAVIGAGDTIQLVLRYLEANAIKDIMIVNRRGENAVALAEKFSVRGTDFSQLQSVLLEADIVLSATGSALPIVTPDLLNTRTKPLVMLDLAVPRDIDPEVAKLPGITLYSIDDLKTIIQQNMQGREHAALKARQVIQEKSQEFMAWLVSFDQVATTIRAYRKQIEELCQAELQKAFRQLQRGEDSAEVLASFAHAFTNKLLHHPSVQLRQAGVEGRTELLQFAQQLFLMPEAQTV